MKRSLHVSAVVALLVVSACGSDSDESTDSEATTAATAAATTTEDVPNTDAPTTTEAAASELDVRTLTELLAADELAGRDNLTDSSVAAQEFLIGEISLFAEPVYADEGVEGYLQHWTQGANILAVVPGGDLADEYVIVGAHYDHLGSDCATADPADTICNGAADNAAGVAAAISAVRTIAAEGVPRRTIILALWDAEEDGLLGSAAYLADPVVPVAQTVGYVNFDIQGANLSPALANTTVIVGAETGGTNLIELTNQAIADSPLDALLLSVVFGQGRSDHANFVLDGVPSVFFTDANNGCYHTAQDDLLALDFAKLDLQVANGTALTRLLAATDAPPVFDSAAPVTGYNDAVSMLAVVERALPDLGLFPADAAASTEQYYADLQAIVDAGPDGFNEDAVVTLLLGAVTMVSALTELPCLPVN